MRSVVLPLRGLGRAAACSDIYWGRSRQTTFREREKESEKKRRGSAPVTSGERCFLLLGDSCELSLHLALFRRLHDPFPCPRFVGEALSLILSVSRKSAKSKHCLVLALALSRFLIFALFQAPSRSVSLATISRSSRYLNPGEQIRCGVNSSLAVIQTIHYKGVCSNALHE